MTPYHQLSTQSTIADEVLDFAKTTGAWLPYYNFYAVQVPFEVAFKDPVLHALGTQHTLAVGIIRLDPNTTYDWHTDTRRGVSVNMLLNDVASHCIFSTQENEATHRFIELQYKPHTYYLFNNQVPHMVMNFNQSRYLLSIEFKEDKAALTYAQLLKELT
jgi:hypothetical protein